ncbi:hypothetical protein L1987_48200 [Smallanthus sonchifolius]|uniref:Uncharacterized protein n=1 Tax=Smallanthus sonchifolius TaxID=185202 RepID=A0ACB9FRC2_9ASTR|nr:hypothetical protein L1987_48200 [Smallanthus sonchifolius]
MVGGTTHQQQQAPQSAHPMTSLSATAHTTTPEKDELVKRNTDCVYFLASPLTCKKIRMHVKLASSVRYTFYPSLIDDCS